MTLDPRTRAGRREECQECIQVEIAREKANMLGRIARKLERALAELAELGPELESNGRQGSVQIRTRYARSYARAGELRWFLVVQREALGLREHADLDRLYPLPASQTLATDRD